MKMVRVVLTLAAATVVTLPALCRGQSSDTNQSQPHFAGQSSRKAQELFRKVVGSVSAMDTNGMTLTIRSDTKSETFKITSKTRFTREDGQPASLRDAAAGKTVSVIIKMVYGQPEEVSVVNIKSKK